MKNMRKQSIILIFITLLVCISIGYALVYTDLKTVGTATINKQTWDVHFENIQVTEGSKTPVSPATITNGTPTQVSYNVYLENPGDFYEFTVDAVNNGTVDAMITDISVTNGNQPLNLPNYVDHSITYDTGIELETNQLLAANTTETYKVRIEFKSNINASDLVGISELNLNIRIKITYSQANKSAEELGNIVVTLDPNGGIINKTTKRVESGKKYGNLPTPTKEGYVFKGWVKNILDEMNEDNYTYANHQDRTTTTIMNDGNFAGLTNQPYFRFLAASATNIDTAWRVTSLNPKSIEAGKTYIFRFYARSGNAGTTQSFESGHSSWCTQIKWSDETSTLLSTSNQNRYFANDGNWYIISETITAPTGVTTAIANIGNDTPNLCGENAYIDIGSIQLIEESPTSYITKNTTVVQNTNHTLIAIWETE